MLFRSKNNPRFYLSNKFKNSKIFLILIILINKRKSKNQRQILQICFMLTINLIMLNQLEFQNNNFNNKEIKEMIW